MRSTFTFTGTQPKLNYSTPTKRITEYNPYSNVYNYEGEYIRDRSNQAEINLKNNFNFYNGDVTELNKKEDDEVPLIEEINPSLIKQRIFYILGLKNFTSVKDEFDMWGPSIIIFFYFVAFYLKASQNLTYFYLNLLFGNLVLNSLINLISETEMISIYNSISIITYSMLPISILAYFSILFTLKSQFGIFVSLIAISYSSFVSVNLLSSLIEIKDKNWLLMYPIALYYMNFILILL